MGLVQPHALQRTVRSLAQLLDFETMGGDAITEIAERAAYFGNPEHADFEAVNAFRVLEGYTVDAAQAREPRIDARQMRGHRQRLPRRTQTTANFTTYIDLPTAGNFVPEQDLLLRAALGNNVTSASGGTSYAVAEIPPALNLLFETANIMGDGVFGWGCDQLTINIPSTEEPTFEFSGPAKLNTSSARVRGTIAEAVFSVTGPAIRAFGLEVGALVDGFNAAGTRIGSPTRVVSRSLGNGADGAGRITLAATIAGAVELAPSIEGYSEAPGAANAFPGTSRPAYTAQAFMWMVPNPPASAATGLITAPTLAGNNTANRFEFQEASITINNNLMLKEPASEPTLTDFCPDYRDVGGSFTFFAGQQELLHKVINKTFNREPGFEEVTFFVRLRLGGAIVGDPQLVIDMPRVQFDRGALELAAGALGSFTLPYMALSQPALNAADNEIGLAYGARPADA